MEGISQYDADRLNFGGRSVCRCENGIITMRRHDSDTEKILDQKFTRLGGGRWRIKTAFDQHKRLTGHYKTAYVIGKGRSIDALRSSDFEPNSLVLCCNEAVLVAERLAQNVYGVRQDYAGGLKIQPEHATMIITEVLISLYYDQKNVILINPGEYVKRSGPTMNLCVGIAKSLADKVVMYGFDAITHKDTGYGSVANHFNQRSDNKHLFDQEKPEGVIWKDPEFYTTAV